MDKSIAEIAGKLTEAQREVILKPVWRGWKIFTYWPDHHHRAMQQLQIQGVFDTAAHWNARWNETGLAVRKHLNGE